MSQLNIPLPAIGAFAHVMGPNVLDTNDVLVPHEHVVVTSTTYDPEEGFPSVWTCPGGDSYITGAPIQDLYMVACDVAFRVLSLPPGLDETELRAALGFAGNSMPESLRVPFDFFSGVTLLRVAAACLQAMVIFRVSAQSMNDPAFLATQDQALRRLATAIDFQACKGSFT